MTEEQHHHAGFHGPKSWILTALAGLVIGAIVSFIAPARIAGPHHRVEDHILTPPIEIVDGGDVQDGVIVPGTHDAQAGTDEALDGAHHDDPAPVVPLWLVIPFAALLLSIAVMPFINEQFWHHHFPDFAFLLGGIVLAYYLLAFDMPYHGKTYGAYQMLHTGLEYYAFIALIGGLFVASGGILIDVRGRGGPVVNTLMLAFGAVIANIVGTTGASVLLIRPFMRVNKGRLRPMHVVFFIFIISNCGGCLTPIGDPPLYLGYLKGVPFTWTLTHLWPEWAACVGMLLLAFLFFDSFIADRGARLAALGESQAPLVEPLSVHIRGTSGIIGLALIIAGVFIDPVLKKFTPAFEGIPIGPTFQIVVALGTHHFARREYLEANEFTFFPVKEVGLLFVGIFATMVPALGYLAAHGHALGLDSPTAFYFGTGSLSGVLDNAPTYLNFLQVAFGETPITPENVHAFIDTHEGLALLRSISLGAVFFGAMTYIGNGPNFMVKAIAEAGGLRMPSFFGYLFRSILILLPILVVVWAIFIYE